MTERISVNDREENEYGLWEFSDEKEDAHNDKHQRSAQIFFSFVALWFDDCWI